jgi:phosphatidylserine/phosphatidylglycerophosphate/cardiolipin synthase-like enzyme
MKIIRFLLMGSFAVAVGICIGRTTVRAITPQDFAIFYSLDKRQNDQALVRAIDGAQEYVYFAIYEFTKGDIASVLTRAKERGLAVRGIMDASQSEGGAQAKIVSALRNAGIDIEFQKHPKGIMHLKLLVTDRAYALGSYNWTESATMLNDEVLEIGTAEPLREQYLDIMTKVLDINR